MTKSELTDLYIDKVLKKEIQFDQLRTYLEKEGLSSIEISSLIREIDSGIRENLDVNTESKRLNQFIFLGGGLTLFGLTVTIGSIVWTWGNNNSVIVISYGAFFGGLVILFAALRRRSKNSSLHFNQSTSSASRQTNIGRSFRKK